jgi:hypothetical protein
MNERILDLYKQAHVPHTAIDPSNNMPYETTCFSANKFAELLIWHATECVRDVLRDENSDLTYTAASQVQKRIKEYFGVEE